LLRGGLPFSLRRFPAGLVSVALAPESAPIWTVDRRSPAGLPGFRRAPSLCAARTFLWRSRASDHPCPPLVLGCQCAQLAASNWLLAFGFNSRLTSISQELTAKSQKPAAVPKGRFELPRGYPHYALNVARLPIPPLRRVALATESDRDRSRPPDSNRRPAVYETAALPTELGRRAILSDEQGKCSKWGRQGQRPQPVFSVNSIPRPIGTVAVCTSARACTIA
jgi:hypothetical protein